MLDFKSRNLHHKNTVKKYGRENIIIHVVECDTEQQAFDVERGLIKGLRESGENLCNLSDGGEGPSGVKRSPELRKKISDALKGRPAPWVAEAQRGRKHTDATRAKMSVSHMGKTFSAETIAKRVNTVKGRKQSDETRSKVSAGLKRYFAERRVACASL